MAIRFPHTISIRPVRQQVVSHIAHNKESYDGTTHVPAFVQAVTPGSALEAFGVELSNPVKVYVDDSVTVQVPQQFTFDGDTYEVRSEVQKRTGLSASLSYCMFLAQKVNS